MTSERERCVHLALEITRIEQHHGLAEIADVIQRAREEAHATGYHEACKDKAGDLLYVEEREQLRAKALIARVETVQADARHHKQRCDEALNALQAKLTALVKAARAAREVLAKLGWGGSKTFERLSDALKGEP